jgi:hypothetical protein
MNKTRFNFARVVLWAGLIIFSALFIAAYSLRWRVYRPDLEDLPFVLGFGVLAFCSAQNRFGGRWRFWAVTFVISLALCGWILPYRQIKEPGGIDGTIVLFRQDPRRWYAQMFRVISEYESPGDKIPFISDVVTTIFLPVFCVSSAWRLWRLFRMRRTSGAVEPTDSPSC